MPTLREQYEEMSPEQLSDLLSNAVLEPDAKRLCEQVLREKLGTETPNASDNQDYSSSSLSAKGRFGRLSFIAWFTLFNVAFQVIEYGIDQLFQMLGPPETNPAAPYAGVVTLSAYVILWALFLYAYFVFAIRRCHDINIGGINSGWLLLPIANVVFLGYLMLKPGIAEANNYGPPRTTFLWEKVVGLIGAVFVILLVLAVVFVLASSLVDPEFRQTINWSDFLS